MPATPAGLPGTAWVRLDLPVRDARRAFEQAYFSFQLARTGNSITRLVRTSGMDRTHLYRKLRQLGFQCEAGQWRLAPETLRAGQGACVLDVLPAGRPPERLARPLP